MTYDYDAYYMTDLKKGAHGTRDQGLCLMELTALFAGERHTDHPVCVSPVLAVMGRELNDTLPDALRQELKPLVPSLPGTAGDGLDVARSYMALDWLIRTWLPAWLDLVPATQDVARKLRELDRIVDISTAERAGPVVREAQGSASAAGSAAGSATVSAAWSVARSAAELAAGSAAGSATVSAAWSAAVSAAWSAAWSAAVSAAVSVARSVARSEMDKVLAPTVAELQRSAIQLYADMIKSPH
jgi:hypothetical protein